MPVNKLPGELVENMHVFFFFFTNGFEVENFRADTFEKFYFNAIS